ncbi:MAG: Gldg family protein [Oscillospiraceae bacterium]|jgi:ABC-2 type transport system permease protein|nr:Gldg family protein [Oscillospiraceae bacterium]
MRAIFKHEFRAYLRSPASYAVTGLFLAVAAVYYTIDNVRGHSADLTALYSTMGTLFLFIVPILTSRIIAEERRSGMHMLLLTSPAKITNIVAGKFLAVFLLIAFMLAFTLLFPLLLLLFTPLYPLSLLGHYVGLLLLGASIAALGIFASALTESQVIAAIISFVTLLLLLIMRPIGAALGGTAAKILSYISPFARYEEMGRGVFSLSGVLYFLGFTLVFLFLTACIVGAGRQKSGRAEKFYTSVSVGSVLAIVLLVNLIAELYPLKADLSEGRRYSVGDTTKELLAVLERDITVYGLFDDGKGDADYIEVRELLENYEKHSGGRVKAEYIDPDLDTQIIAQLDPDDSYGLRKNDFYVTDGNSGKKLSYQDLFRMEYDQKTSAWFKTGSGAEKSFSEAIRALEDADSRGGIYIGDGYTLFASGGEPVLPEFGDYYEDLILEVPESVVVPLESYGLYFPTAQAFDAPDGSAILVASPDGKTLAAAWERDGFRAVLVGSSDFLSETVKSEYTAHFAVNEYFRDCALEWVNAASASNESEIEIKDYGAGELQIPRHKADYIGFLTVIVLPLAVFLRGFIVWRKRRFL